MAVSKNPSQMYNAPIPGASLTGTPGAAPWEKPPQYTDLNDALMYMWDIVLKDADTVMKVLAFLRKGFTVTEITNTFLFTGAAAGKWSLDLAMLMYPIVVHQLEVLAKLYGVKYKLKRVPIKTTEFVQQFGEYLKEPDNDPVEKQAKKMFATGLGMDEEQIPTMGQI